jgi:hypothetical protein
VRWQTALRVSDYLDEEDRAANSWLAGNNAAVNQNDAGLHGAEIDRRRSGKQASARKKAAPPGRQSLWRRFLKPQA